LDIGVEMKLKNKQGITTVLMPLFNLRHPTPKNYFNK